MVIKRDQKSSRILNDILTEMHGFPSENHFKIFV
jgi:hypothetical protein